jgi:hypothetical protein
MDCSKLWHIKKNLIFKSTMFPRFNVHKFIWTSPDGKTCSQIDHILTCLRRHSSALDAQSFMKQTAIPVSLVVANVRERLTVSNAKI